MVLHPKTKEYFNYVAAALSREAKKGLRLQEADTCPPAALGAPPPPTESSNLPVSMHLFIYYFQLSLTRVASCTYLQERHQRKFGQFGMPTITKD